MSVILFKEHHPLFASARGTASVASPFNFVLSHYCIDNSREVQHINRLIRNSDVAQQFSDKSSLHSLLTTHLNLILYLFVVRIHVRIHLAFFEIFIYFFSVNV
jgi:hypothetical protein